MVISLLRPEISAYLIEPHPRIELGSLRYKGSTLAIELMGQIVRPGGFEPYFSGQERYLP
jgi:hypothetical protein